MTKRAAVRAVREAVMSGVLRKPKCCHECKREGRRLVGHHYLGYAPENALKVRWLCDSCHHAVDHRELRKTADPDDMARIVIEVDEATHYQLRIKAIELDTTLSAVGRTFLMNWLAQQEGAKQ